MATKGSFIKIVDNTCASYVKCFSIQGKSYKSFLRAGDIITGSVKYLKTGLNSQIVKKGAIVKVLIIKIKRNFRRNGNNFIKVEETSGVLLDDQLNPMGTRINSYVFRELRDLKLFKIISLSKGTL
jgi:large subunit ribosomal protein L14